MIKREGKRLGRGPALFNAEDGRDFQTFRSALLDLGFQPQQWSSLGKRNNDLSRRSRESVGGPDGDRYIPKNGFENLWKLAVNAPANRLLGELCMSRAMENCPLGVTRNCPLLGIAEERANERGTNHGKPVVE